LLGTWSSKCTRTIKRAGKILEGNYLNERCARMEVITGHYNTRLLFSHVRVPVICNGCGLYTKPPTSINQWSLRTPLHNFCYLRAISTAHKACSKACCNMPKQGSIVLVSYSMRRDKGTLSDFMPWLLKDPSAPIVHDKWPRHAPFRKGSMHVRSGNSFHVLICRTGTYRIITYISLF
jgi:hypothetical protein